MLRFLLIIFFPAFIFSQNNYTQLLDSYVLSLVKLHDFAGVVMVTKNDSVCLKKAYGFADREAKILNTTETKFRLASISKQFTAACILLLEQQGKLSVKDKLSKYFPDFPKADSVDLHLLLCHRSGIGEYIDEKDIFKNDGIEYTHEKMLQKIKKLGYDFSPGKKYMYSNSNYYLLGLIIEKVSGSSYENFVTENIFKPLKMLNSGIDKNDLVLSNKAKGYELIKGKFIPGKFIKMETAYSAGNIYSTVGDMYLWGEALKKNDLLTANSKAKMFTAYSFDSEHYGYGAIPDSFMTHQKIWHSGGIYGYTTQFVIYPKENITIIILSNSECEIDNSKTSDSFAGILFGMQVINPYIHKEIKQDAESLKKYTGNYRSVEEKAENIEIVLKDGKLYRQKATGKAVELKPEGNNKFFYNDGSDRQLQFTEENGVLSESLDFIFREIKLQKWVKVK